MTFIDRDQGGKMETRRNGRGRFPGLLAALFALSACVSPLDGKPRDAETMLPVMGWDGKAGSSGWTAEALLAVAGQDDVLAGAVPADIDSWCPGYEKAGLPGRRAFWVAMMSAVSRHESGWNEGIEGGGGRYIGLMQISPRTAAGVGCKATSKGALKDGGNNLACAVEIFAAKVARDGVVAGSGNRGMGRDWMPFRKARARADMAGWVSAQPYCQG